jgi:hypothetical protein
MSRVETRQPVCVACQHPRLCGSCQQPAHETFLSGCSPPPLAPLANTTRPPSSRANRNITITGPEGRNAANADVMPVIDLMHKPGILELCATCHFVFAYVNTAHGERGNAVSRSGE